MCDACFERLLEGEKETRDRSKARENGSGAVVRRKIKKTHGHTSHAVLRLPLDKKCENGAEN